MISCGKNSNGPEFQMFGARLNSATMIYEVDPAFDYASWQTSITGKTPGVIAFSSAEVRALLLEAPLTKVELVKAVMDESGCKSSAAYNFIKKAENQDFISRNATNKTMEAV